VRAQLSQRWKEYLVKQPESGMGYQQVDVTFADGSARGGCLVFNASEIELPSSDVSKRITTMVIHAANRRSKGH